MSSFPGQIEPPSSGPSVPDPGSPRAAKIAWIFTIILMVVVVAVNQLGGKEPEKKATTQAAAVEPPDPADPFTLTAKFIVKMAQGWGLEPSMRTQFVESLTPSAKTP